MLRRRQQSVRQVGVRHQQRKTSNYATDHRTKTKKLTKMGLWAFTFLGLGLASLFLGSLMRPGYRDDQVQAVAQKHQDYYLENQHALVSELQSLGVNRLEDVAHYVIPSSPATYIDIRNFSQYNVPYYNQNDPRWAKLSYGTDGSKQVWENGCAIVVLAMIDAYYSGHSTQPKDIIDWAGNQYYLHQQGTSWSIFPAFGQAYGYEVQELGNHLEAAKLALDQGKLVVVSVGPGTFTQAGHIMLLRGHQDGRVFINDPNDSPDKLFSIQGIDDYLLSSQSLNYWAIGPN